jgi:putative DNA primase/helicase
MNAAEIAAVLGPAYRSGQWWRCVCPVHGSRTGHSVTLALRDGPRGVIVHCHAGCSATDILSELRRSGLLHGRFDRPDVAPPAIHHRDRARRIEIARRIWAAGSEARGTPVVQYLASRCIDIDPPPALRWAPRCWHHEARAELPAMLARVDGRDGALVGVHRTYLRRDEHGQWRRRDRATLGPIAGGAVRLAPAAETLIIAEGIESTIATMIATGLPGWSALSTSGLVTLVLPTAVRVIIIAADHDASGAGERAARTAAQRWLAEGRRVRIAMPPGPGTDMADVLLVGRAYARIAEVCDAAA